MRDYQTQPCPSALAHSTFLESQSDRKDRDVEVVVPLSCVRLFVTPWTAARQASLSITKSQSLLKLMSIEPVMPSNHFIGSSEEGIKEKDQKGNSRSQWNPG